MWQQASVVGFAVAGAGGSVCLRWIERRHPRTRSLVPIFVLFVSAWRVKTHFPKMNRSHVRMYGNYARDVLEALPADDLLLVNDGMNCNLLQYLTRCEGVRPDVALIRLPLITYEWWKRMQLHHFDGLQFPGENHHPYEQNSFAMIDFLNANVTRTTSLSPTETAGKMKQH